MVAVRRLHCWIRAVLRVIRWQQLVCCACREQRLSARQPGYAVKLWTVLYVLPWPLQVRLAARLLPCKPHSAVFGLVYELLALTCCVSPLLTARLLPPFGTVQRRISRKRCKMDLLLLFNIDLNTFSVYELCKATFTFDFG